MKKLANLAILSTSLSLCLIACTDSSNYDQNELPGTETSKISESNATKVVGIAFSSLENLNFLSEEVQSGNVTQATKTSHNSNTSHALPVIYCGADPFNDTGSGSMDIIPSGDLTTNFNLGIEFLQCQLTDTAMIDGSYDLNISGNRLIGPQFSDGSNTTSQTFNNLTITESSRPFNALVNGEISTSVEYVTPVLSSSESVNLMIAENSNEIVFTDWVKSVAIDFSSGQLALDISGNFSATSENGSFSLEMLEPLMFEVQQQNNDSNATLIISGKFKVTAADNSSVTVTIMSATEAQLEIDEDGDGIIDSIINVSIDDLNLFSSIN